MKTAADAHGQDDGLEAITALKNWAEHHLQIQGLLFPIDRRNVASRRIPEKLGGQIISEGKVTSLGGLELDGVVFRIDAVANGAR